MDDLPAFCLYNMRAVQLAKWHLEFNALIHNIFETPYTVDRTSRAFAR